MFIEYLEPESIGGKLNQPRSQQPADYQTLVGSLRECLFNILWQSIQKMLMSHRSAGAKWWTGRLTLQHYYRYSYTTHMYLEETPYSKKKLVNSFNAVLRPNLL